MWQILGLLVFCGLLSPSVGKVPGIRCVFNAAEIDKDIASVLTKDDLLKNHLKGLGFNNINLGGLLSLVGSIAGLKITDAQLTAHGVVLHQDRVEVTLAVHLGITGDALLTTTDIISISLDLIIRILYRLENYSEGNLDVIFDECGFTVGTINVSLLGGLLPSTSITTIQQSITADLNAQVCAILKVVFDVGKDVFLSTLNGVLPFGIYGNVKIQMSSLPELTASYVGIDIYTDLLAAVTGLLISIPETASSIPLPPLLNYRHCQAIHPALLNILLSVLSPKQPRELSCTPDAYSKADDLRNAVLALIPAAGSGSSFTDILYIKISPLADAVIALDSTGGIVSVNVEIEFFFKNTDGSILSVLIVRSILILKADFSVLSSRLYLAVSISTNTLVLVSSGVGIIDTSSLLPHCNDFLDEIYLPLLSGPLAIGFPLPSPLGSILVNVSILFSGGALVLCI